MTSVEAGPSDGSADSGGAVLEALRARAARACLHALPTPFILGHRGVRGPGAPPENTLPAIERAHAEGADGVEIDVRMCGSGEVVVLHDPGLDRVTGGADTREVTGLHHEELSRIDLGGGAHVPTLREVLERTRQLGLALDVELKRDVPSRWRLVLAVARALSASGSEPRVPPVFVSSFDPLMLAAFRAVAPRIPTALLLHPEHRQVARLATSGLYDAVIAERTMVRGRDVGAWRAHGRRALSWTVNDETEAQRLAALGVEGFITDRPAALRATLG